MRVYISGPMTDNPNYKRDFEEAEERIKAAGHIVVNPCMPEGLGEKEEYLMADFAMLQLCDCIYVLPDSQYSIGSVAEQIYAYLTDRKVLGYVGGVWCDSSRFKMYRSNEYIFWPQFDSMRENITDYVERLPELPVLMLDSVIN